MSKKHIRYFSIVNPWIDFVVTVNESDSAKATGAIYDGIEAFCEDGDSGWCYGDYVETALTNADITYDIMYHDSEDMSDEYEEKWEASLPKNCETI